MEMFFDRLLRRPGDYGNVGAVICLSAELHHSVTEGVQRVIIADPNICSGIVLGASLTNNDVSRFGFLASENLDPEAFTMRFASS